MRGMIKFLYKLGKLRTNRTFVSHHIKHPVCCQSSASLPCKGIIRKEWLFGLLEKAWDATDFPRMAWAVFPLDSNRTVKEKKIRLGEALGVSERAELWMLPSPSTTGVEAIHHWGGVKCSEVQTGEVHQSGRQIPCHVTDVSQPFPPKWDATPRKVGRKHLNCLG